MGLYLGKEKISNVASVITQNADSMATEIQNHIANSNIHITAEERTKWNAAADKSTEGSTEVSLPVNVEILETICENIEFTKTNNTYTFPIAITIDSDGLYYISYQRYKDAYEAVDSGFLFSKPETINDVLSVRWLSNDINNSITMTSTKIVDTWVGSSGKSIVSIYKVNIITNDEMKKAALLLEGYKNITSGSYSHAEGRSNTASGYSSHAEGYGNIASYDYTHVQGKYNTTGNYAHIVGNGTSDTARSNAHVLDWSGNAWFAGDVYANGVPGKAGTPKKLATEVPVSTADNGKVLSVVNGAWAATAMSSGAYVGSYTGDGSLNKTLTFNFKPAVVMIAGDPDGPSSAIGIYGFKYLMNDRNSSTVSWTNNSFTITLNQYSMTAYNSNNVTYYYIAIPAMN